jgi:two-component system response regulator GlrR
MQHKGPHSTTSLGFGIHRAESESKQTVRKARILVVDNDLESRRFLNARLAGGRYRVDTVDNSQAALDACVRSRPNLVISELRLGPMDGLALLKELKSRWPALTVIIVTAHATIAEAVRATQCGAFGFLVKPIEREELLGQVERALAASTFASASDSPIAPQAATRPCC